MRTSLREDEDYSSSRSHLAASGPAGVNPRGGLSLPHPATARLQPAAVSRPAPLGDCRAGGWAAAEAASPPLPRSFWLRFPLCPGRRAPRLCSRPRRQDGMWVTAVDGTRVVTRRDRQAGRGGERDKLGEGVLESAPTPRVARPKLWRFGSGGRARGSRGSTTSTSSGTWQRRPPPPPPPLPTRHRPEPHPPVAVHCFPGAHRR